MVVNGVLSDTSYDGDYPDTVGLDRGFGSENHLVSAGESYCASDPENHLVFAVSCVRASDPENRLVSAMSCVRALGLENHPVFAVDCDRASDRANRLAYAMGLVSDQNPDHVSVAFDAHRHRLHDDAVEDCANASLICVVVCAAFFHPLSFFLGFCFCFYAFDVFSYACSLYRPISLSSSDHRHPLNAAIVDA